MCSRSHSMSSVCACPRKQACTQAKQEKPRSHTKSKSTYGKQEHPHKHEHAKLRYQELRQEQCEPRLLFETHPNVTPNPTMLNAIECSKRRPRTLQHDSEGGTDGECVGVGVRSQLRTSTHIPVCATHTNMKRAHHYIRAHATSRPCDQEKQIQARNPMHERPPLTQNGLSPSQ
jgi:hypothetical protein